MFSQRKKLAICKPRKETSKETKPTGTLMRYYSTIKKEGNFVLRDNMDEGGEGAGRPGSCTVDSVDLLQLGGAGLHV